MSIDVFSSVSAQNTRHSTSPSPPSVRHRGAPAFHLWLLMILCPCLLPFLPPFIKFEILSPAFFLIVFFPANRKTPPISTRKDRP